MSYNVRYFGHATRGITSTRGALLKIARAISDLDPRPDVIALQEVETSSLRADIGRRQPDRGPQLSRLIDALHAFQEEREQPERYRGYYFPGHRYKLTRKAALYTTGLALLCSNRVAVDEDASRPPRDITHRRIRRMSGLKQTRICAHLHVTHRASGLSLDVFNTHLSLPAFLNWRSVAFTRRMGHGVNQLREIESLLEFFEETRTAERALILGDFNTLPGSPVHLRALEAGLLDPFTEVLGLDDAQSRAFPTAGFMNLRMHLDHAFSTPAVRWLDMDDTHPHGEGPFRGLSDHMPIIGRVA